MKKILLLSVLFISVNLIFAQETEQLRYLTITQKECVKKKGYRLLLKSVVSDSRCPEGVNCIWAGEIQAVVSVYQDKKLLENATLTFSSKTVEENKVWFSKYLPAKKRNIKSMEILPYPKDSIRIDPKSYFIKIGYSK